MEEDARNRKWDEINAPDPNEGRRFESVSSLQVAINHLSQAWAWIYQAVDDVDGLPIADEIESFEETVMDIRTSLETLQKKLKGEIL